MGAPYRYSETLIMLAAALRVRLGVQYMQLEGTIGKMIGESKTPSFSQIRKRMGRLDMSTDQRGVITVSDPKHSRILAADATRLKQHIRGEWMGKKWSSIWLKLTGTDPTGSGYLLADRKCCCKDNCRILRMGGLPCTLPPEPRWHGLSARGRPCRAARAAPPSGTHIGMPRTVLRRVARSARRQYGHRDIAPPWIWRPSSRSALCWRAGDQGRRRAGAGPYLRRGQAALPSPGMSHGHLRKTCPE